MYYSNEKIIEKIKKLNQDVKKIINYYNNKYVNDVEYNVNNICKNIWLGNIQIAQNKKFVDNEKIECIINVTKDIPNKFNSIKSYTYHIRDRDACQKNLMEIMEKSAKNIHENILNGKNILVHCKRGHHRSAAVLAFYLMKYHNKSLIESIKLIKARRPSAFRRFTCLVKTLSVYEIAKKIHNKNVI